MIGRIMHLKSQQRHKEYIQEVASQIKRLDMETLAASSNEVNQSKLKHLKKFDSLSFCAKYETYNQIKTLMSRSSRLRWLAARMRKRRPW